MWKVLCTVTTDLEVTGKDRQVQSRIIMKQKVIMKQNVIRLTPMIPFFNSKLILFQAVVVVGRMPHATFLFV